MSATPALTSIIYVRVSTADQDLDHQCEALWEYAIEDLEIAAGNLSVLEDRSTGTDVDRSGYRRLIERSKGVTAGTRCLSL